jgi:hypothetical protein
VVKFACYCLNSRATHSCAHATWHSSVPELLSASITIQFTSKHGAGEAHSALWGGGPGPCACLDAVPDTTCLAYNEAQHDLVSAPCSSKTGCCQSSELATWTQHWLC